jgi:hypothetical protein
MTRRRFSLLSFKASIPLSVSQCFSVFQFVSLVLCFSCRNVYQYIREGRH